MLAYKNNIEKIKSFFPDTKFIEYAGYENEELYETFFQFCQNDMVRNNLKLGDKEALFYYTPYSEVMAGAELRNNILLLAVNKGAIEELHLMFNGYHNVFQQNSELNNWFNNLANMLNVSIGSLMYQCSTVFLYRHELTHLIQKANFITQPEGNLEVTSLGINKKQIREMDADINATYLVCGQLISYFRTLDTEQKNIGNLEKLLTVGISSIYIYLLLYCKESIEIYFNQYSHPHPLLRLSYIVDHFVLFAEKNLDNQFKINSLMIVNNCLNKSEIFNLEILKSGIDDNISNTFANEKLNIKDHILALLNASFELPELEMNNNCP